MKERPILFSAPMVRALLSGAKTQTRRVIAPQPSDYVPTIAPQALAGQPPRHPPPYLDAYNGGPHWCWWDTYDRQGPDWIKCPWGVPGDQIVVRETFRLPAEYDDVKPSLVRPDAPVWYEADPDKPEGWGKTRVSIHMPRWASRITLEITGVRVERLNDCSPEDAKAEGLEWVAPTYGIGGIASTWNADPVLAYRALWEHINGPGSRDANPWVWVLEFKRIEAAHG